MTKAGAIKAMESHRVTHWLLNPIFIIKDSEGYHLSDGTDYTEVEFNTFFGDKPWFDAGWEVHS